MVGRLRTLTWLGELILGAVGSRAESPKWKPRLGRPRTSRSEPFCASTEQVKSRKLICTSMLQWNCWIISW